MQEDRIHTGEIVLDEPEPGERRVVKTAEEGQGAGQGPMFDNIASSVKEVAQKTGEVINRATESIGKAIESALSARDHVVMVRVNDEALKRLDALVQSGIFKSRSESAAFLISEGIKAQSALFDRIDEKIQEIERLRAELKSIVEPEK
jgi:Arc/MetJ-type ribon-helix-helix transcriptional regulator